MDIPADEFERIASEIRSDNSPVGFDALKTHVMILYKLGQLDARLRHLEDKVDAIDAS